MHLDFGPEASDNLDMAPYKFGRPATAVSDDGRHRPRVHIPSDILAAVDLRAKKAFRGRSQEIAAALAAYLDAHRKLPATLAVDNSCAWKRITLPVELGKRLDSLSAPDDREAHIIAALKWWVSKR